MTATTTHFKVDNGDMTLIALESGRYILIDCKIRCAADDPDDSTPDVGAQLKDRLPRDDAGRPYVDAFLLTHPDQDHCGGLRTHFHLGDPSKWNADDDKIIIREMWSSPIVFRRADKECPLCDDAKAWAQEARRRVKLFRSQSYSADGDHILILGEDIGGKTDDLGAILVPAGSRFSIICGAVDASFEALLLAPLMADDEEEDEVLSKNNSSVILNLTLAADGTSSAARYLFGGDAEVAIWEKIWARYEANDLKYDVLLSPHHCSWHSLSWDSWSEKREDAKVSPAARKALGQVNAGATILASSYAIEDDDDDPPCIRAKHEYQAILKPVAGAFVCLADESDGEPLELTVSQYGPKPARRRMAGFAALGTGVGSEALGHG
ncbi:hypothetical protein [Hyphomicrobium sp. MC1]|uniref:hypothetical protein n=1 Tax=Hyphomicrobium sp. (strain MC1) TaxID=717785 RepID=UPI000213F1F6|nr:hypothetical protein [Hyphomicrobium sp. MC1]CCB65519.1 conserved protein of unknown function, putative metallo-hydrolase [Hyphomicrobium sp. MC1]